MRPARERAYLISNAQVTGLRPRTVRRKRRDLVAHTRSLVVNGLAETVAPLRTVRTLHGNCERPIPLSETGGTHTRPTLDTYVRCRKCEGCLRQRRALWCARAASEIGHAERTWMVTLTASPAHHHLMWLRICKRERDNGADADCLPDDKAFAERWRELGSEVTRYLKRVRAGGSALRYLTVVEAHKSGLPHVHLLVHDMGDTTWRALTSRWHYGFAHAKLVEGPAAARYVTKYLMKSALARVRASKDYGNALKAKV